MVQGNALDDAPVLIALATSGIWSPLPALQRNTTPGLTHTQGHTPSSTLFLCTNAHVAGFESTCFVSTCGFKTSTRVPEIAKTLT